MVNEGQTHLAKEKHFKLFEMDGLGVKCIYIYIYVKTT